MRLLGLEHWKELVAGLKGRRWGYCQQPANVGDLLIARGAEQLLRESGIETVRWNGPNTECAGLLLSGGGNLGMKYPACARYRWLVFETAKTQKLPVVILPQTATDTVELPPKTTVWLREHPSKRFYPQGRFAPDLALAFDAGLVGLEPQFARGLFLRKDREALFADVPNEGDPVALCQSVEEYLWRARKYKELVTDRLHFAIAGLMSGRDVTLLPCNYHKSRSVWEASLRELGCKWRDRP